MNITLAPAEIALFLLLIALLVLVFYLIRLAKTASETLRHSRGLISTFQIQMEDIRKESQVLFERVNSISANFENKLEKTDPLFQAIENVGEILDYKTAAAEQKCHLPRYKEKLRTVELQENLGVIDLAECALSILKICKKLNGRN